MNVYSVCFETEYKDSGRAYNDAIIISAKVKGENAYKMKWDFTVGGLDDPKNKTVTISASDPFEAIRRFIANEFYFDPSAKLVGYNKVSL